MDPATVGGLAIGVALLAFDVFDNCVKCRIPLVYHLEDIGN